MPKKKAPVKETLPPAEPRDQLITDTIETNYMPYAMSVIISRAIPEIDGFKPSQRKLLYTMFKMGLLGGNYIKSANIVGETMKLNPHGDATIYDTMVRMTRGYAALLHPFIDSKGSFGKVYSSTDLVPSASRYTGGRLDPICHEIFRGIDKDAVDMIDNYDETTTEPRLLPTSFPNILVSPNTGIAVGMATRICSFNLAEICDGAIEVLTNPRTDVDSMLDIVKAPDFSTGAQLLYERDKLAEIYATGRGSFRLRAKYRYNKKDNCIEITDIPYSTSLELIMKRLSDLVKEGKLKEITEYRDEIDITGFTLAIDLRRGTDPDKLMAKLFKLTPLEDDFPCNFNVIIDNAPKQLGIIDILKEWVKFRIECVRRELTFDLNKKKDKLHLLLGLGRILLDIDKAIKIVRETKIEKDVVPNLMKGFDIDEVQAEFVAEIKLRHLNREYILNRVQEIDSLQKEIAELESTIASDRKLRSYIVKQLKEIKEKYGKPRMTEIVYNPVEIDIPDEEPVESYPVHIVATKEGYFKKISMQSLRGNDEQALKEGDEILLRTDGDNTQQLLVLSDKARCYKAKVADFDLSKSSVLGDFIPAKLGFEKDEKVILVKNLDSFNPKHHIVFLFANGKGVRIPVTAYETKSGRKKLTGAYSESSPIVAAFYEEKPMEVLLQSDENRAILISTNLISEKTTRTSQGIQLFTLKKGHGIVFASIDPEDFEGPRSYKKIKVPATGVLMTGADSDKQIKLI